MKRIYSFIWLGLFIFAFQSSALNYSKQFIRAFLDDQYKNCSLLIKNINPNKLHTIENTDHKITIVGLLIRSLISKINNEEIEVLNLKNRKKILKIINLILNENKKEIDLNEPHFKSEDKNKTFVEIFIKIFPYTSKEQIILKDIAKYVLSLLKEKEDYVQVKKILEVYIKNLIRLEKNNEQFEKIIAYDFFYETIAFIDVNRLYEIEDTDDKESILSLVITDLLKNNEQKNRKLEIIYWLIKKGKVDLNTPHLTILTDKKIMIGKDVFKKINEYSFVDRMVKVIPQTTEERLCIIDIVQQIWIIFEKNEDYHKLKTLLQSYIESINDAKKNNSYSKNILNSLYEDLIALINPENNYSYKSLELTLPGIFMKDFVSEVGLPKIDILKIIYKLVKNNKIDFNVPIYETSSSRHKYKFLDMLVQFVPITQKEQYYLIKIVDIIYGVLKENGSYNQLKKIFEWYEKKMADSKNKKLFNVSQNFYNLSRKRAKKNLKSMHEDLFLQAFSEYNLKVCRSLIRHINPNKLHSIEGEEKQFTIIGLMLEDLIFKKRTWAGRYTLEMIYSSLRIIDFNIIHYVKDRELSFIDMLVKVIPYNLTEESYLRGILKWVFTSLKDSEDYDRLNEINNSYENMEKKVFLKIKKEKDYPQRKYSINFDEKIVRPFYRDIKKMIEAI